MTGARGHRALSSQLPAEAQSYLSQIESSRSFPTANNYRLALLRLHRWLATEQLQIADLQRQHIIAWLKWLHTQKFALPTRHMTTMAVRRYIQYLATQGHLRRAPEQLLTTQDYPNYPIRPHPATTKLRKISVRLAPLPVEAQPFLTHIESLHRPNTVRTYGLALRRFHAWLAAEQLSIEGLERRDVVAWLVGLQKQNFAPATRQLTIVAVSQYFKYLAAQGRLRSAPQQLLNRRDYPKLPETLPRALNSEHDQKLRALLATSTQPAALGLLLMRQTGLRVGELIDLAYHCIRDDGASRRYLRVPVGKLHSERLVPISDDVVKIIEKLQALGRQGRNRLVAAKRRYKISRDTLSTALVSDTKFLGIHDDKPVTTHRLRHTYATEMLNAGMSLGALKEILGHRDVNMTLRYAKPTLDLISSEYTAATTTIQKRYYLHSSVSATRNDKERATTVLETLLRTVERNAAEHPLPVRRQVRNLVKRLQRIGRSLEKLQL